MKKNYTLLITIIVLILCAVIVHFGRIYFPENFEPNKVSFFENYWVLILGLCFVIALISIFSFLFFFGW